MFEDAALQKLLLEIKKDYLGNTPKKFESITVIKVLSCVRYCHLTYEDNWNIIPQLYKLLHDLYEHRRKRFNYPPYSS